MTYTPNADDATQPTDAVAAETATLEFQALKTKINTMVGLSTSGLSLASVQAQVNAIVAGLPIIQGSYISGNIAVNVVDTWLAGTTGGAAYQEYTPTVAGLTLQLPAANAALISGGYARTYKNAGLFAMRILDGAGVQTVGWLPPGTVLSVYLTSKTTAAGTWKCHTGDKFTDSLGLYTMESYNPVSATSAAVLDVIWLTISTGVLCISTSSTLSLIAFSETELGGRAYGTPATIAVNGASGKIVALTATTLFVTYGLTATGVLNCLVATVTPSTLAVALGTAGAIGADTSVFMTATALSPTLVLVAYNTGGTLKGATVTIAGAVVTPNAVVSASGITTGSVLSICTLSATLAHICANDTSNGPTILRITVAGTVVAFGAAVTVKNNSFARFSIGTVDATHSALVYNQNGFSPVNAVIVTDAVPPTLGTETVNLLINGSQQPGINVTQLVVIGSKAYIYFAVKGAVSTNLGYRMARLSLGATVTLDAIHHLPDLFLSATDALANTYTLSMMSNNNINGQFALVQVTATTTVSAIVHTLLGVGA